MSKHYNPIEWLVMYRHDNSKTGAENDAALNEITDRVSDRIVKALDYRRKANPSGYLDEFASDGMRTTLNDALKPIGYRVRERNEADQWIIEEMPADGWSI